jgi:importin subunit alpha-6/7
MSSRRPTSESRRSEFKNQGLTQDEFRRRREENSVELRKSKKEDTLNKRRNIVDVKNALSSGQDNINSSYDDFENSEPLDFDVKFIEFIYLLL